MRWGRSQSWWPWRSFKIWRNTWRCSWQSPWHPIVVLQKLGWKYQESCRFVSLWGVVQRVSFVEGFFDVGAAGICWFLIYLSGSLLSCTKEGAAWRQRISQNRSKSLGWYRMIYPQKFKIDTRNWPCMAILKKESPFPNQCEFSMVYVTSSHKKRFDVPNLAWHMGDQ